MEFRKCTRCRSNHVIKIPNDVGEQRWKYICLNCCAEYKPVLLSLAEVSQLTNAGKRRMADWKKSEVKKMEEEWVDTTERAQFDLRKEGWKVEEIIT
jgi:hypothetical protein